MAEKKRTRTSTKILETDTVLAKRHIKRASEPMTQTEFYSMICNLISNGYYDDKINAIEQKEKTVFLNSQDAKEAQVKIKEMGYKSLGDAIHDVIRYEKNTNYNKPNGVIYNGFQRIEEQPTDIE